jgi:hypothetical protein
VGGLGGSLAGVWIERGSAFGEELWFRNCLHWSLFGIRSQANDYLHEQREQEHALVGRELIISKCSRDKQSIFFRYSSNPLHPRVQGKRLQLTLDSSHT